ncbi:aminoglycoside 2'-N-acetyltransferase I [Mumia flava]|uniref:Aminoglycoside 2'-N-acetyltransferase I n=1 Tax=Mumia flava TaxID=1348852 RepID=A0A0B2BTT9_9ACTN|nr:GNAT family N-acetyltransferase [Mumia flava]PJJ57008.1 aminoglycoside 2'-N-acetyltransferase I [Mumia flava]
MQLQTRATKDLGGSALRQIRAFLVRSFDGDLGAEDWEHTLGGTHVLAYRSGVLLGHASVVTRTLWIGTRSYATGYVEGVAVAATRRRRGLGTALMGEVARLIEDGYDLGALASTDLALPFYGAAGWIPWRGPTSVVRPDGSAVRTPEDDGSVFVLPCGHVLDASAPISCDWRRGDVW